MPKRVLIVDDSERMTRIISKAAALAEFDSRQCNDPHQALDTFIEFQPDVVVLDMCMPEKDGIDVLEEILLTGTKARIILTSGYHPGYFHVAGEVAAFHRHDNISFLQKPFGRERLVRELTRATE